MLLELPLYCSFKDCQPRAPGERAICNIEYPQDDIKDFRNNHILLKADDTLPFSTVDFLGHGSEGQVDRVKTRLSGQFFARKRRQRRDAKSQQRYLREIRLLTRIKIHWHVVEIIGSYEQGNELGVLMLPVAQYDLQTALQSEDLPISTLGKALGCLVTGLAFLHNQNVLHGDIKPSNILVHDGQFVFTDFGCSKDLFDMSLSASEASVRGTLKYAAPEVISYRPRGRRADVFSLGCVLAEIWSVLVDPTSNHGLNTSFRALAPYSQHLLAVKDWIEDRQITCEKSIDLLWLVTCKKMLLEEPRDRPKAQEILDDITASLGEVKESEVYCQSCVKRSTSAQYAEANLNHGSRPAHRDLKIGDIHVPAAQGETTAEADRHQPAVISKGCQTNDVPASDLPLLVRGFSNIARIFAWQSMLCTYATKLPLSRISFVGSEQKCQVQELAKTSQNNCKIAKASYSESVVHDPPDPEIAVSSPPISIQTSRFGGNTIPSESDTTMVAPQEAEHEHTNDERYPQQSAGSSPSAPLSCISDMPMVTAFGFDAGSNLENDELIRNVQCSEPPLPSDAAAPRSSESESSAVTSISCIDRNHRPVPIALPPPLPPPLLQQSSIGNPRDVDMQVYSSEILPRPPRRLLDFYARECPLVQARPIQTSYPRPASSATLAATQQTSPPPTIEPAFASAVARYLPQVPTLVGTQPPPIGWPLVYQQNPGPMGGSSDPSPPPPPPPPILTVQCTTPPPSLPLSPHPVFMSSETATNLSDSGCVPTNRWTMMDSTPIHPPLPPDLISMPVKPEPPAPSRATRARRSERVHIPLLPPPPITTMPAIPLTSLSTSLSSPINHDGHGGSAQVTSFISTLPPPPPPIPVDDRPYQPPNSWAKGIIPSPALQSIRTRGSLPKPVRQHLLLSNPLSSTSPTGSSPVAQSDNSGATHSPSKAAPPPLPAPPSFPLIPPSTPSMVSPPPPMMGTDYKEFCDFIPSNAIISIHPSELPHPTNSAQLRRMRGHLRSIARAQHGPNLSLGHDFTPAIAAERAAALQIARHGVPSGTNPLCYERELVSHLFHGFMRNLKEWQVVDDEKICSRL